MPGTTGFSKCVITPNTPATCLALLVLMLSIVPAAMVLPTKTAWQSPFTLYSAAYLPLPVTLATPSTRPSGGVIKSKGSSKNPIAI
ncbi:hypothetical protein D3C85_1029050 [compost metagenome]